MDSSAELHPQPQTSQASRGQCKCGNTLRKPEVMVLRGNVPGLNIPTSSGSHTCLVLPSRGTISVSGLLPREAPSSCSLPLATATPEILIHGSYSGTAVTNEPFLIVVGYLPAGLNATSAGWGSSIAVGPSVRGSQPCTWAIALPPLSFPYTDTSVSVLGI